MSGTAAPRPRERRSTGGAPVGGSPFLDSDDTFVARSLELRLDAARAEGVEVVHSECHVLRDGATMALFGVPAVHGWIYRDLLKRQGPMFQGLLPCRWRVARIGGLDEQIVAYQEWDTSIRLAREYAFGFVSEPTFVYDCRGRDRISRRMRCNRPRVSDRSFESTSGRCSSTRGRKRSRVTIEPWPATMPMPGAPGRPREARAAFAWWPVPHRRFARCERRWVYPSENRSIAAANGAMFTAKS